MLLNVLVESACSVLSIRFEPVDRPVEYKPRSELYFLLLFHYRTALHRSNIAIITGGLQQNTRRNSGGGRVLLLLRVEKLVHVERTSNAVWVYKGSVRIA